MDNRFWALFFKDCAQLVRIANISENDVARRHGSLRFHDVVGNHTNTHVFKAIGQKMTEVAIPTRD